MALKIIWSEEADFNLDSIIKYLQSNWTEKELKNFSVKLDEQISLIAHFLCFTNNQNDYKVHVNVL